MKFNLTQIASALALSAVALSAQAVTATLTFSNSAGGSFTSGVFAGGAANAAFTAGNEFRMINPFNSLTNGQKDTMGGNEVWVFATTQLSSVSGTGLVGPAPTSTHCAVGGCTGIDDGALFFGDYFGFLAPTVGNTIGLTPATINLGGLADGVSMGDTFSVLMPLAEAHWGGARFPMANVTFNGTVVNGSGGFVLTAEHTITPSEDPDAAGFAGFTAQWRYEGTVAAVPEASTYGMMLAGLGLVGFAVRRRKLVA